MHGYYVFPYLMGERLVARVDLKTDRAGDQLLVLGAFCESRADPLEVATALAADLLDMAQWLGVSRVEVGSRGDLAAPLTAAVHARL